MKLTYPWQKKKYKKFASQSAVNGKWNILPSIIGRNYLLLSLIPVTASTHFFRLGLVPVSEASVVLAISSVHRAESLDAVQFGINELKKSVPIWKKEVYEEGNSEWKVNAECEWVASTNKAI
jgi:MoaE protein